MGLSILHCIDTTGPGGAETVFVQLAERFRESSSLAVIRGPGWVEEQLASRNIPFEIHDCKGSFNLAYLRTLIRIVRRRRIDLIHAHLLGSNVYCSMAGAATGTPVISTFHGNVDISPDERLRSIKFAVVRRLSTIVAVSPTLRDDIAAQMRMSANGIACVPNAIDVEKFANARPAGLRHSLGIGGEQILLGSLGNVRPAKAYHHGAQALRLMLDRGIDAQWVIAGHHKPGATVFEELQAEISRLNLEGRVHLVGFVPEPESFLAELDIYLLCSTSEGHPLSVIQAMAAGKPIVTTRCGVEGVVSHGSTAWITPVGDTSALAEAVAAVLGDRQEAQRRGERARREAMKTYELEAMFQRYQGLYDELSAPRAASAEAR